MKIPLDLHEQILARAAKGATTRELAKWMGDTHAIKVSHEGIAAVLRKHRRTRAEVSKTVVNEHISATLPQDLQEQDEIHATNVAILREVQSLARSEPTTANIDMVSKMSAVVQKHNEAKAKALGVDQPNETEFQGLAELVGLVL